jgi:hypothetical protein
MRDTERQKWRVPQRGHADAISRSRESKASRYDLWVSFVAASSVVILVSSGLLVLILELRSGWVSDHEVLMDKGPAIHNLMFRP